MYLSDYSRLPVKGETCLSLVTRHRIDLDERGCDDCAPVELFIAEKRLLPRCARGIAQALWPTNGKIKTTSRPETNSIEIFAVSEL